MKHFLYALLMAGLTGWLTGGCSEKLEPKPATYSQLLTGTEKKAWKLISYQIIDDGQKQGVQLVANEFNPCRADDLYIFYAGEERKFEYANGSTKCGANEKDVLFDDTWSLVNVNATLNFIIPTFDGSVLPYTIKNLTPTVLTVELYLDKLTSDNLNVSYQFTFNSTTK